MTVCTCRVCKHQMYEACEKCTCCAYKRVGCFRKT